MSTKGLVCAALSFLLTVPCFAIIPPQYEIIDLGTLQGGTKSSAYSINNMGQIVGWAENSSSSFHAVLFDPTGGNNNIDLSPSLASSSSALSINNGGQIVGYSYQPAFYKRATIFNSSGSGNNTFLVNPWITFWCASSEARSINNLGQIVGNNVYSVSSSEQPTMFDPSGTWNNNLLYAGLGSVNSINDYGIAVGNAISEAAIFDSTGSGNIVALGKLAGGTGSTAFDVNNNSQIVGTTWFDSGEHATLFDPSGNGNNIDLGSIDSYSISEAHAINNQNQIVGWAITIPSNAKFCAVLFDYTGAGNNIDLNTLLPQGSGWNLRYAYDINDNGWIVGRGRNPAGQDHAYLLKPVPEPATISLLLLGSLTALRRKRK